MIRKTGVVFAGIIILPHLTVGSSSETGNAQLDAKRLLQSIGSRSSPAQKSAPPGKHRPGAS